MAEACWLECPELFEEQDPKYGLLGPFGDSGIDSDTPFEDLDPTLVAEFLAYEEERIIVAENCDRNHESCVGPQVVYDIKTRKAQLICPITPEPYYLSLE